MDILSAVIYGIVEGITEFLPISSTGHLMLLAEALGDGDSRFTHSFEIVIQLGAVLAVLSLYVKRVLTDARAMTQLLIAFIPTLLLGFLLYPIVKGYLAGNTPVILAALFLGGVFMIFAERSSLFRGKEREVTDLTPRDALLIGLIQTLAFIPGVSRSAATIYGGLARGLSRVAAVEFSFLLALPTMLAATSLDVYKNMDTLFAPEHIAPLLTGTLVSFIVALAAIKWLLRYVTEHGFFYFGIYRITLAVIGAIVFYS